MLTFYIELYNSTRWLRKDVSIFPKYFSKLFAFFKKYGII